MKIFKKIKQFIKSCKISSYDKCYHQMEIQGFAVFMCCCGMAGGDSSTDYLSYTCVDCPYFVYKK